MKTSGDNAVRGANSERARPEAPAQVAARTEAARRSSRPLLDPHGIYGTRTAGRLRAAQRRRSMQTLLFLAVLIALGFGLMTWARARRVLRVSSRWTQALMAVPSAPPILVALREASSTMQSAKLLVPTEEGLLLSVDAANGAVETSYTTDFPLRAQPLAIGDTVFVAGSDGVLAAVQWRSGRILWKRRTSAGFSTRPAFARLFFPSRRASTTPRPVSAATPAFQPSRNLPSVRPPAIGNTRQTSTALPPLDDERKARGVVFAGNDSGEIVALEASSGRLLWRHNAHAPVGSGLSAISIASAAKTSSASGAGMSTHGARVLVPLLGGVGSSGGVLCLDARNGRALWRKDLGAACLPAPVVDEGTVQETAPARGKAGTPALRATGRVYCSTDNGAVLCLDLATGSKIWKVFVSPLDQKSVRPKSPSLQSSDGFQSLEVGAGSQSSGDEQSGAELSGAAAFSKGDDTQGDDKSVIALRGEALLYSDARGKRLVLGGNDGGVRCLDARSGAVLWSFDARFAVRCRPAALRLNTGKNAPANTDSDAASLFAGDLILIGSDGPVVYALDARDGVLAWQFATQGDAFYTPLLHKQELLAVSGQGYAQSFDLPR